MQMATSLRFGTTVLINFLQKNGGTPSRPPVPSGDSCGTRRGRLPIHTIIQEIDVMETTTTVHRSKK